jgi:hypothetical protein
MLNRRAFAVSALGGIFTFPDVAGDLELGKCERSCFNSDFPQLGYDKFFRSIFDLARNEKLKSIATGRCVRAEMTSLFGHDNVYRPIQESIAIEWQRSVDGFQLSRVRFDLECGVPVIGCLGTPNSKPRGLILLGHGIASLPERCFTDAQPDYMRAIGKKLCQDGYAVWCPYILQEGDQSSQNNMAAMLLSQGVSLHNVSCSSLDAGEIIANHVARLSGLNIGCYGVSWSAVLALHLEAALGAQRPTVASGYMRDEKQILLSSWLIKNLGSEFASYIHFQANDFKCAGRAMARLLQPTPVYIEVGSHDDWNSNEYGRDRVFEEMRSVYQTAGNEHDITMGIFEGPHEAHGVEARKWLLSLI